jgi:hypothetical protein
MAKHTDLNEYLQEASRIASEIAFLRAEAKWYKELADMWMVHSEMVSLKNARTSVLIRELWRRLFDWSGS